MRIIHAFLVEAGFEWEGSGTRGIYTTYREARQHCNAIARMGWLPFDYAQVVSAAGVCLYRVRFRRGKKPRGESMWAWRQFREDRGISSDHVESCLHV